MTFRPRYRRPRRTLANGSLLLLEPADTLDDFLFARADCPNCAHGHLVHPEATGETTCDACGARFTLSVATL